MNWLSLLQSLHRRFPRSNDPPTRFSIVEKWLQKNLRFRKAVLWGLQNGVFEPLVSPPQTVRLRESPEFRRLVSGRPWIAPRRDRKRKWQVYWPVSSDGQVIACWVLGPRPTPAALTGDEKQFLELLADWTSLWLEKRRLWAKLESSDRQATLGWVSAAMAHEIRNPLSALNTLVQLLPQKGDDPQFRESFQITVVKEIGRLIRLTDDVLGFLRVDPQEMRKLDFKDLADHTTRLVRPLFASKKVELAVEIENPLFLTGNEGQLECFILNLLQNALNAVGEGGKVEISAKSRSASAKGKASILLMVKDNGKGIPKEELPFIFRSFYSSTQGGSGLGLAICEKIVMNHGGRMEVKSVYGKGSIFSAYFPALPRHLNALD